MLNLRNVRKNGIDHAEQLLFGYVGKGNVDTIGISNPRGPCTAEQGFANPCSNFFTGLGVAIGWPSK
jgi:hypothetical protein